MSKNKTPAPPQMSGEERDLLRKQGVTLDQFNTILSDANIESRQTQDLLKQMSGIYNPDGTLNREAVDSLRARTQAELAQRNELSQSGRDYLQGMFRPDETGTLSDQAGVLEAQQYINALRGDISLSPALAQQEAEKFKRLKESAGQRGIRLSGDDPFTATSDSTAGNQLLSQLRKESQLNREIQRENALNRLGAANLNRLGFGLQRQGQLGGFAQSFQGTPGGNEIGLLNQGMEYGPSRLVGAYGNLAQSFGQAIQPYQQQRYLQYQSDLQNQANKMARKQGIGAAIGGIAGAAIGSTVPGGTALGFGLGSGAGGAIGGLF